MMTYQKTATPPDVKLPDPVEMSKAMTRIAERSRALVTDFWARHAGEAQSIGLDPLNVGNAFLEMTTRLMSDPTKLMQAQMNLWQDYMTLWQRTAHRMLGGAAEPAVAAPAKDDKRFKDPAWDENAVFDYMKQSYLLTSRWLQSTIKNVEGVDDKTARKVDFYTRQFVDAMSPTNFVMTNPEVLRATVESRGENLVKGLQNLLHVESSRE